MKNTEVLAALDQIQADIRSLVKNLSGEGNSNKAEWLAKIIKSSMDKDGRVVITYDILDILKTSGRALRLDKQSVIHEYMPFLNFRKSGWPKVLLDAQIAVSMQDLKQMLMPSIKEKRFTRADVSSALSRLGVENE